MRIQKLNWPIWVGLLLSVFALVSYPFVFVRWPMTRDFPWANLLLFGIAAVVVVVGVRRAFAGDRSRRSKIAGAIGATLSGLILALFVFSVFIVPRWMPSALGAPKPGQKAPEFTLNDTNGKPVALSELLSSPVNGKAPKGVLLVFYRGNW